MLFVNSFRRSLHRFPAIYLIGAFIYHKSRNTVVRLTSIVNGYRYFSPKPSFGPYFSQFGQDRALESLGLLVNGGVFVEVGSNHPMNNSNSYYLESKLGYSGISVDPIDYSELYRQHRPKTEFINAAIDSTRSSVILNLAKKNDGREDQVSSLHSEVIAHGRGFEVQQVEVSAVTLASVCKNLSHIDLLLLDVEGHEIDVLNSLDWDRIQPDVVLAENTGEFYPRKLLEDFMINTGYRLVARIGSSDDIYQLISKISK